MRFEKLTLKAQEAFQEAQRTAERLGHQAVDVEHIVLAVIKQPEGTVEAVLKMLGANPGAVARDIEKMLERIPRVSGAGGQVCARRVELDARDPVFVAFTVH